VVVIPKNRKAKSKECSFFMGGFLKKERDDKKNIQI
jgi:hypothetical protein